MELFVHCTLHHLQLKQVSFYNVKYKNDLPLPSTLYFHVLILQVLQPKAQQMALSAQLPSLLQQNHAQNCSTQQCNKKFTSYLSLLSKN
jgi:hypothetical protein